MDSCAYALSKFVQNLVYISSEGKFCPSTKWAELEAFTHDAFLYVELIQLKLPL